MSIYLCFGDSLTKSESMLLPYMIAIIPRMAYMNQLAVSMNTILVQYTNIKADIYSVWL